MTVENLKKALEEKINSNFKLKTTKNSRIILQIENKPDGEKIIKVHSCFIDATSDIIDTIVRVVLGKKNKHDKNKLVEYAKSAMLHQLGHNVRIDCDGNYYNLKRIFDLLNERYFKNKVSCSITYGKHFHKKRSRSIIFGNYDTGKNLIRINRALDSPAIPEFFVRYIIFHEMLHAYLHLSNRTCSKHSKEFKKIEASYPEFQMAEKWKKENLHIFIDLKREP